MQAMSSITDLQSHLQEAQAALAVIPPRARALYRRYLTVTSASTKDVWKTAAGQDLAKRWALFLHESAELLEDAHGRVFKVETAAFAEGITVPGLHELETYLEKTARLTRRMARAWSKARMSIVRVTPNVTRNVSKAGSEIAERIRELGDTAEASAKNTAAVVIPGFATLARRFA